jgi:hypothetical protein
MIVVAFAFTFIHSGLAIQAVNKTDFRLAVYYQDNMVLQREPHNAIIWGYASSSDATVTVSLLGREYTTRPATDNSSIWKLKLDPIRADNKPVNITIGEVTKSGLVNSLQLTNVLFGDVWLCVLNFFLFLYSHEHFSQKSSRLTTNDFV